MFLRGGGLPPPRQCLYFCIKKINFFVRKFNFFRIKIRCQLVKSAKNFIGSFQCVKSKCTRYLDYKLRTKSVRARVPCTQFSFFQRNVLGAWCARYRGKLCRVRYLDVLCGSVQVSNTSLS